MPIATDEENAIVNAIAEKTSLYRVGCVRHLRSNIKEWVDSHQGTKEDRRFYVGEVMDLIQSENEQVFYKSYLKNQQKWNNDFKEYFRKSILPRISTFGLWEIRKLFSFDVSSGMTTNQPEGFNFLLKSLQSWHEVPVDVIMYAFHMLQRFYLKEISRGKAGLGNYSLHNDYKNRIIDIEEIGNFPVCAPEKIIESLKNKKLEAVPAERTGTSDMHEVRAQEIIEAGGIGFSPKLGIFSVITSSAVFKVSLLPKQSCSCDIKASCHHILAVRRSLRMKPSDTGIQEKTMNLTYVREKAKGKKKQKSGRKRPHSGDQDYTDIDFKLKKVLLPPPPPREFCRHILS